MTSKGDSLKTNEFLRLRKLRLQQVREQSKDIAKKIRQRAKVEQLRHVTDIDKNKEKEYLQRQEKLVNRLEQLYSKSLQNVGAGHKNACDVNEREIPEKIDLSKIRGKEAAAILKKKKQERLDEKKKLLDRKLQAREVANVLSREKFVAVVNSLTKSSSGEKVNCSDKVNDNIETQKDKSDPITKNDMGTQWEFEEIPNEWEPHIPSLCIPIDDSIKNSAEDNLERSDENPKSRRLNLFALSDEMPSSLRGGGVPSIPDVRIPMKTSLTLVSEYLQTRGLRLRESDTTTRQQKKNSDDLQSIKQTLLRTRASKTGGSVFPNICHVLDEQVIPVPCWKAEKNCCFCSHANERFSKHIYTSKNNNSFDMSSKIKPGLQHLLLRGDKSMPCPTCRKCHQDYKTPVTGRSNNIERTSISDDNNKTLNKKNSVTMYDHNTRDTRDLPHNVDKLVVRDQTIDDDAYSQAFKETSVIDNIGKPPHILQQETRNRLAITRQNVDKEYRDTLAFLNSLPKEKPAKSIKTAYMDGNREQELKDKRQHKLQQEYKKIEKQCSKHQCKHVRNKLGQEQNRSKSKSPAAVDRDNNIVNRDFQYSWLPVPESDGSMAIHNIPNTVKDTKAGNTVKFSSVDTYHEYRSRHKHTPPTKDINNEPNKRVVEAVIIQENSNGSVDSMSETDTSSVENLQVRQDIKPKHVKNDKQLDNAERIIIYKVMESKNVKKHKTKNKSPNIINVNENLDFGDKDTESRNQNAQGTTNDDVTDNFKTNTVSFTQLKEGIYKSVSSNGLSYNVMSCCTNVDFWQTASERKPWWDNITSLYFSDDQHETRRNQNVKEKIIEEAGVGTSTRTEIGSNVLPSKTVACDTCKNTDSQKYSDKRPSAATSNSSFKTAVNDKPNNVILDGGYVKFIEEGEKDTGKFYVGASGFLKDDAYEVIIQLRKKEAEKISRSISQDQDKLDLGSLPMKNIESNDIGRRSTAVQSTSIIDNTSKDDNETENQNISPKIKPTSISTNDIDRPQEQILNDKVATTKDVNEVNSKTDNSTIEPPAISDKGISTTFRDIFAIPDNTPKADPISRPVASICTQTTHNSPIPKPVFMHLSSSTSTTYMSPPELILPRYLMQGTSESFDDTYEPVSSNFNPQNMHFTSCKTCKCGKCKRRDKGYQVHAPPNTTRSTDQTTDHFANKEQHKKCARAESRHKNVKYHKCKHRSESKICSKQKFKRISSENKRFLSGSNYSTLSIKKSKITNKFDKVNINPVVENYVKQLLALNNEGLKAIEIVNQECSAVNTPGSSIIEVPSNINKNRATVCNKISLEQIKSSLEEQILKNIRNRKNVSKCTVKSIGSQTERNIKLLYNKSNKKRPVHKIKSFNISKQLIKGAKDRRLSSQSPAISTSPCSIDSKKETVDRVCRNVKKNKPHIQNSPTSTEMNSNPDISNNSTTSGASKDSKKTYQNGDGVKACKTITKIGAGNINYQSKETHRKSESHPLQTRKTISKFNSSTSEKSDAIRHRRNLTTPPNSISTQTNQVDSEVEFMKLAENKLQNMEKIADLTEKCTKRLSNLAKVLEEVRRNKSLAYSQVSSSDCTTDSDQRSDKNMQTSNNRVKPFNPTVEIQTLTEALSSMPTSPEKQESHDVNVSAYVPILMDLPKPDTFKTPSPPGFFTEDNNVDVQNAVEHQFVKNRGKPPPALTRMNLKNVPDGFVIPHELSTVVEVDSPMSIKLKSHTTQTDIQDEVTEAESVDYTNTMDKRLALDSHKKSIDPNGKFKMSKKRYETHSTDTSNDSKIKMMDLQYFNEIMLKPFISLKDFAKKYNIDELDGQPSLNGMSKDENVNEELSSLHSEASLPDVMAELLKRNLISEPFKFETTSNVNSTTVSSESTVSLLALTKARKDKKNSTLLVKNKENIAETSVSLSISSNPDLEHAFQRLGMGWASSTLKKTKERLALSSSSNTSSSSIPQFKIKSFNYQDVPELSSLLNISNKEEAQKSPNENLSDIPKNALQQTSLTNSMTVKEFLTNELANKITFSNKTNRNSTDDEFISLCETKMPEEMKHLSQKVDVNEKSVNSPTGGNTRARTSTPVQIFKSMTYHSTSSSNTSNGLFSNADDLSSVKGTSNSIKNHSTSDKDDLTIPNYSLKMRKEMPECSKSD